MVNINSFEDLKVWQKARELTQLLYKITSKFPQNERFGLVDQIRRASVSVMANIAEGFSRYHSAETIMFYQQKLKTSSVSSRMKAFQNHLNSFYCEAVPRRYSWREPGELHRNARGSLTEVKSHLYVCLDLELIESGTFKNLVSMIDEIGKTINGLIKSTKSFRSKLSSNS